MPAQSFNPRSVPSPVFDGAVDVVEEVNLSLVPVGAGRGLIGRVGARADVCAAFGEAVFSEVEFELDFRPLLHGPNHEASDVAGVRNLFGALRNV